MIEPGVASRGRWGAAPLWVRILLALAVLLVGIQSVARADLLRVNARNDKPGPVDIRMNGWDDQGNQVAFNVFSWSADDNTWTDKTFVIPFSTAILRFTFINDVVQGPGDDLDRNAFIDYFEIDGKRREAETFDRDGGPDPSFPGCDIGTVDGRTVAGCGNNLDYAEYDLAKRFFKAPFPNYAPSGIPDFSQKQDQWAHEILCGPNMAPDSAPVGDDIPLPGPCLSPNTPIIGKGPNGLLDTPVNNLNPPPMGDDFYRYDSCVPTAVANCLWWFDSKFETDIGQPACDSSDTYSLVTAYAASSDDHCTNNVDDPSTPAGGVPPLLNSAFGELVEDLAWRMDTGGQRTGSLRNGTTANDMDAAVRQYLSERGLSDEYIVRLTKNPEFEFVAREVRRSQNVILSLSFVQNCQGQLQFVGGHAVTTAGVDDDPGRPEVCLSDPFFDLAEAGSTGRVLPGAHGHPASPPDATHNDASVVSHDCYPVQLLPGPFGQFALSHYANVVQENTGEETDCTDIANFFGQNQWDPNDPNYEEVVPCNPACPLLAMVSYALEISPFFWKAGGFPDYAPNGMPDFDQKQGPFMCPLNQTWSYCGPTAVANSFWWFDSKFEPTPQPPPIINDNYRLVETFDPLHDDHDPANVEPLIDALGDHLNTDNRRGLRPIPPAPYCGTYIDDMEAGVNKWLADQGLDKDYFVRLVRAPDFEFVAEEVEKSQDMVLLLGFWQLQEGEPPGEEPVWVRIGGHYVTTAGVDREGRLIAISDPYLDSAESGAGSGRVLGPLPHPHPAAPPPDTAHNDAQNVSHDLFDVIPVAAPGGLWGLKDYAAQLGPDINNFFGQNSSDELDQEGHPVQPPFGPEPIVAVVDYVLEVSPCPLDADGDGFRPLCDNDCNDNDPNINPGATETCDSVDNNCDGQVDEGFPNLGSSCMVGVGACLATGTFVCSADGTTSVCDAVPGTPAAEDLFICDGIDNNCDGRIDEVFPQDGVTNVTGTRGPGAQDITLNWQGGQPTYTIYRSLSPANVIDPANIIGTAAVRTFVDPAAPGQGRVYYYEVTSSCSLTCPEICDGVDNDCDGLIDEAGAAAFCSVPNATPICVNGACDIGSCTSPFDDCDMSSGNGCESDLNVDPNNCSVCGTACSYANAVPVCVLGNCMMGNCHTGFDDCNLSDADGCEVNLNNDPNNCSTCGNACSFANASSTCIGGTCQLGPCLSGWDDCNQTASDGCEQDLFFDVNHCGACGNVCMLPNATPTCAAGSCQIASCNAPYMDCNQVATDGCEVDPSSDINNCGFCGNVCSFANASASCSNSQCTMGACDPNYWDINNDPADGCEYSCTFISPTDEPDPGFTDENCDGIDGDVTRALYVSPTGSNSNTGTDPSQAFLTISHAISVSSAAGRNQILVAEGQYQDTLSLRNGVGIYGNYTASFASRLPTIGLTEMQSNSTTAVTSINDSGPTVLEYLRIISAPATQPGDSSYGIVATSSSGLIVRRCNVISGNGDAGVHASSPGGTAASGGSGGRGDPGCEDSTEILCEQCPQPLGGFAGFSSCGGSGGQGGAPGRGPQNGLFGQNSGAGTPGGPGTLDGQGNWNTPMLHWGLNGANGLLGSNGIPGSPGYSSSGYTPSNAANGQDGRHGDGGGGGGGGGGGTNFCWSWGGGGGGGGGGGCGGSLADGGTSAGGSFAIYLWASNATIEDSVLETGRGGLGGRGGTGQSGGAGGMGGHSFDPAIPGSGNDYGGVFDQDDGSNSGRGGDGGAGGDGGHGGGGAGGPTIGIIRGGGSMPNLSSNIFILGSPGPGGTSNGIPGPTGLRTNVYTP